MSDKCNSCGKKWTHHAGIASTCAEANAWKVRAIAAENALLVLHDRVDQTIGSLWSLKLFEASYMSLNLAKKRAKEIDAMAKKQESASCPPKPAKKKRKGKL